MNQKQFFMILLALAVVGGAGLVLIHRNQQSWGIREAKAGDKLLPDFQINDVATIHIKGNGADFNVIRTNESWRVQERDNYAANFPMIKDFLLIVRNLKVVQSDLVGPSQLTRLNLASPGTETNAATLVEFKDEHDKVLAALLAGKLHPRPQNPNEPLGLHGLFDGRYILLPNDPHNALMVSDPLMTITTDAGAWLSPDFFKAENVKFISLASTNTADSWEISRDNNSSSWVLDNPHLGESLNIQTADDVGEILAFPTFNDVARKTPGLLADDGLDKPITVTVLTDEFAYTLKVGRELPDGNYPMTISVQANISTNSADASQLQQKFVKEQALSPWIFEASTWIDRVIRIRSQLVEKKMADSGQAAGQ